MIQATDDSFDVEVLQSKGIVLVDFWSYGCGPCNALVPVLQKVETDTGIKIVKVNVSDNQKLGLQYNIAYVPTMIFFKDGVMVKTSGGFQTEEMIKKTIASL